MKATRLTKKEAFTPFDIKLSVESEEEARALYAIFNYTRNRKLLGMCLNSVSSVVLDAIGPEYYVGCPSEITSSGIPYSNFYRGS